MKSVLCSCAQARHFQHVCQLWTFAQSEGKSGSCITFISSFWCCADLPFLAVLAWVTLCCVWGHPSLPLKPKHGPQGVPPWETVSPALKNTIRGDTAVKQNLCPSLSPGCQGWTLGMLPGDKGRLVAWFLHMLTFVRTCVLSRNSFALMWVWWP